MGSTYRFISHQEAMEKAIEEHDRERPFAPENGQPLKFKVGDTVMYTNDYGVEFLRNVTELYNPDKTTSLYAAGYRYYLNNDSYWMPVKEASLQIAPTS